MISNTHNKVINLQKVEGVIGDPKRCMSVIRAVLIKRMIFKQMFEGEEGVSYLGACKSPSYLPILPIPFLHNFLFI